VIHSNDHLTAIRRRERAPSTTSIADIPTQENIALFDHFIGAGEQHRRDFDAERSRRLEVDDQLDFGRLLDR
jgi:hypothetical protein